MIKPNFKLITLFAPKEQTEITFNDAFLRSWAKRYNVPYVKAFQLLKKANKANWSYVGDFDKGLLHFERKTNK